MKTAHHNEVAVRVEQVVIPTYLPAPPDRHPMFLEKRVYQGSSGRVYPLPFTDRIAEEKTDREWTAVLIENDFLEVMILPELGGRIHAIYDKLRGRDLIYRQQVIKPALVGLAGSWISGGIEFNWAQHHRPATFLPVDWTVERTGSGGAIVWLGDHEPLTRMKSMQGVSLAPERAVVELKVRVHNRTPLAQTFLWWANAAVKVHEGCQSFFPPDVRFVADHAKRAMSAFPLCDGTYYGVDYAARARRGVPPDEIPRRFVPPHISGAASGLPDYAPNDLSWYANIPVPTSYMCVGADGDFFGGYDHYAQAGIVHVADRRVAPGKKQWTWGNHDFGYAWDRNLSDDEAPYIELMAGVFTDNQPDFSHLAPFETKSWSQFWYGIGALGVPVAATADAALSVVLKNGTARISVGATARFAAASITVRDAAGARRFDADLEPAGPFFAEFPCAGVFGIAVADAAGRTLVAYEPPAESGAPPPPATEIPPPASIASADELYLAGRHLEQYRHATRAAADYWLEILRRDPLDWRANNALGLAHLRRGEFSEAAELFRRAIERLTARNPNPETGEAHYHLGLALRERDPQAAFEAFAKAAWNAAEAPAARLAMAELEAARKDFPAALARLDEALADGPRNLWARNLKTLVLRRLGRDQEAAALLAETRRFDPLDAAARILDGADEIDLQTRLDAAHELARAGFLDEAAAALGDVESARGFAGGLPTRELGAVPIALYTLGHFAELGGDAARAAEFRRKAAAAPPDYCFPHRSEEIAVLRSALEADPADARAAYYLGCLYYDRRRYAEAVALWERAAADDSFPTVWRNLGIAYFNVAHDGERARAAFEKAFAAAGQADARILYERDQLAKRLGDRPAARLAELERFPALVAARDDLSVETAALLNRTGRHADALALLAARRFQPWEGGEGRALAEYTRARLALGRKRLEEGNPPSAAAHFEAALAPPENLGEGVHPLANQSDVRYFLGLALDAADDRAGALREWRRAAYFKGDFREMSVRRFSEMTYYSALALGRLDAADEAAALLGELCEDAVRAAAAADDRIDYFATSLPSMLLFDDDLAARRRTAAMFIEAQARFGLGETEAAAKLLRAVLEREPDHAAAADFARGMENFEL
ncbi:MAG: tetratricopeptide repeat protein [Acidobacteria bacterium]|nr:tetratricopeptide repeat protein [Acidobacteriota bacterium]